MAKKVKQSWLVRCMTAKTTGKFTEEDRKDAYWWNSCAVGEQRKIMGGRVIAYKRIDWGVWPNPEKYNKLTPVDEKLKSLGNQFNNAVITQSPVLAMELLEEIEDRALELKRSK